MEPDFLPWPVICLCTLQFQSGCSPCCATTGWWFGTFFLFPCIGNNCPNWLSYFSDGLKPPTRLIVRSYWFDFDFLGWCITPNHPKICRKTSMYIIPLVCKWNHLWLLIANRIYNDPITLTEQAKSHLVTYSSWFLISRSGVLTRPQGPPQSAWLSWPSPSCDQRRLWRKTRRRRAQNKQSHRWSHRVHS